LRGGKVSTGREEGKSIKWDDIILNFLEGKGQDGINSVEKNYDRVRARGEEHGNALKGGGIVGVAFQIWGGRGSVLSRKRFKI